ncbi:hypothetical protein E2C01_031278 [Portunus trituberculatus]|uniref:Uncharacterized protein n=1 Tax=Portunus trituberculatus TaxID=210409 RepID=A0A5B7EX87_PORTR|nr:hypothetical protein [Portunus trituberculatus]
MGVYFVHPPHKLAIPSDSPALQLQAGCCKVRTVTLSVVPALFPVSLLCGNTLLDIANAFPLPLGPLSATCCATQTFTRQ